MRRVDHQFILSFGPVGLFQQPPDLAVEFASKMPMCLRFRVPLFFTHLSPPQDF
jgi:hypothetical protein